MTKITIPYIKIRSNLNNLIHLCSNFDGDFNYRTEVTYQTSNQPRTLLSMGFCYGVKNDGFAIFVHVYQQRVTGNYQELELPRYRITDCNLLSNLAYVSNQYSYNNVMDDIMKIYNITTDTINFKVFHLIANLSKKYPSNYEMLLHLSALYLGMVAEAHYRSPWASRKHFLGKRIKFIALYKILIMHQSPYTVAKSFKGMSASYLLQVYKNCYQNYKTIA